MGNLMKLKYHSIIQYYATNSKCIRKVHWEINCINNLISDKTMINDNSVLIVAETGVDKDGFFSDRQVYRPRNYDTNDDDFMLMVKHLLE